MSKQDFHKELGEYLTERNKIKGKSIKEVIKKIFSKKDEVVGVSDDFEVYSEEGCDKRKDKVSWFKKVFSSKKEKKEDFDIDFKLLAEDAIEDLKILVKISLESIKNLSDEKLKEFKKSEGFNKLKKLLKKYELIK
jgi:hypothetical protein